MEGLVTIETEDGVVIQAVGEVVIETMIDGGLADDLPVSACLRHDALIGFRKRWIT